MENREKNIIKEYVLNVKVLPENAKDLITNTAKHLIKELDNGMSVKKAMDLTITTLIELAFIK